MEESYCIQVGRGGDKENRMGHRGGDKENRMGHRRQNRQEHEKSGSSNDSYGLYSSGVFCPVNEDGSDYQQMNNFQRRGERVSAHNNSDSSPQSGKEANHSRTTSDITPTVARTGRSFTLNRSKSSASKTDRWRLSSSSGLLQFLGKEREKEDRETETGKVQRKEEEVMEEQRQEVYTSLARKYEATREDWRVLTRRCEELEAREGEVAASWQEQVARYKAGLEDVMGERNKYKAQCTQAIQQWHEALREKKVLQEKLVQVGKEKEELLKEIDQAMNIRIKASKDIKRLTEERNSALHEYSVIMGERDSVIRELERLQDELGNSQKEGKDCQLLQREITAALADRDETMKEVHELRRRVGEVKTSGNGETGGEIEGQGEVGRLQAKIELLEAKLKSAVMEADVAKGRRDWAFAERDKIMLESEAVHSLMHQMRLEKDRAVARLAERLGDKRRMSHDGEVLEQVEKDCIVKQMEVQLCSEEAKGLVLSEGVYVRAVRPANMAARSGKLGVGDRIVSVDGVDVRNEDGLVDARRMLQGDRAITVKIESLTVRLPGRAVERSASQSLKMEATDRKLVKEVGEITKPAVASRLWASSERVYSISNNAVSREPKKPWSAFTETVKEKWVKGTRRQSTEPGEGEMDSVSYKHGEEAVIKRRSYSGVHQDAIRDINHLLRNHHIENRPSDAESLENLDNKIQEMRQMFTSSTPGRVSGGVHRVTNPQDVVQSHYQQVQSRIQANAALQQNGQENGQKEDYFLTSSASETSLNDSLKSGNLEEHEVLDCSSISTAGAEQIPVTSTGGTSFLNVTSPKRTSPFPSIKGCQTRLESVYHQSSGHLLTPARDNGLPPSYLSHSGQNYCHWPPVDNHNSQIEARVPAVGDIRSIHVEKTTEQLGINIREVGGEGEQGGIFICSVNAHSIAARVGLHVGDQILEVCGVNLRTARFGQAQAVLQMATRSMDIKVEYQPSKLCPTRPNQLSSPVMAPAVYSHVGHYDDNTLKSGLQSAMLPTAHSTLISDPDSRVETGDDTSNHSHLQYDQHQPRIVNPIVGKSGQLGIRLVGGNVVGIFVHSVETESPASKVGLQRGDQVLEYNGTKLAGVTAEQAAYELAKPVDRVSMLVHYNPERYKRIKDVPGDSYFVQAMFDRCSPDEELEAPALMFHKEDVLQVENTMHGGVPGSWAAWLLDDTGKRSRWGVVPSKHRVEEEIMARRGVTRAKSFSEGIHELSRSTRSSFFKKKRLGRENKELAVYSDAASLLSHTDAEKLKQKQSGSYLRVEKHEPQTARPVLIVGAFSEAVGDKLVSDYPTRFGHCEPEYLSGDMGTVGPGLADSVLVDFRRRGGQLEATTLKSLEKAMAEGKHCLLDIHLGAVETLHQLQIFPIVLFIKYKSVKQLREVRDIRYLPEPLSQKDARHIQDTSTRLEVEYKHLISSVVPAGTNLMLLCAQIAAKIEIEQKKAVWVPSGGTIW